MDIMTTLIVLALVATIVSLVWGVGSMAVGSEFDHKHDAQFMNARVAFQGVAVALILAAIIFTLV